MTLSPTTPVIVGAAQFVQQKEAQAPLDPLGLMAEAGRRALASSGADTLGDIIDAISVANIVGWSYADAPGELGQALGLSPAETTYLPIGGQSPQMMVNRASTLGPQASQIRNPANRGRLISRLWSPNNS